MNKDINLPIYMDYASTTPVDPRVAQKISDHLTLDGLEIKQVHRQSM